MKRRNLKETPTPKTEVGKTKLTIRYLYLKSYRKPSEQNSTPKHKTNGTTTEVSPWNDQ